jgi:hypothetical protein
VCLYVILTGALPFAGDRVTEIHAAMLDGGFKPPAFLSQPLQDLFMQIFEVKPAKVCAFCPIPSLLSDAAYHSGGAEGSSLDCRLRRLRLPACHRCVCTDSPGNQCFSLTSSGVHAHLRQGEVIAHMLRTGYDNEGAIIESVTNHRYVCPVVWSNAHIVQM